MNIQSPDGKELKATPTPWFSKNANLEKPLNPFWEITSSPSPYSRTIAILCSENSGEDAAYIIKAVNSYEDMKEQIRNLTEQRDALMGLLEILDRCAVIGQKAKAMGRDSI
jgi:hypothetical protein